MIKKLLLTCLISAAGFHALGQNRVPGRVIDEGGQPLAGVAVVLEGTGRGVVTGGDGSFTIEIPAFPAELTFSFLGYAPWKVVLEARPTGQLVVEMKEEASEMETVVVVGYGQQRKISIVGAVSTTSSKEIVKAPVGSLGSALTGRLTGLTTIQNSGQPGAESPTLRIRGVSTLTDANPLIIVDGVEQASGGRYVFEEGSYSGAYSGWESINPNDVESISILKDASSTAVYGVKGANGVIIITTKKGFSGEPVVSYTGSYGVSTPIRLRHNIGSYEFGLYANEGHYNDGRAAYMSYDNMMRYRYGYDDVLYPSMDYTDYMLKKASHKHAHNISIQGGGGIVKYFTSVGYYDENGMIRNIKALGFNPNMTYNRMNLRTNLDFNFTKRLSASLNIDSRMEKRSGASSPSDSHFFYLLYKPFPWSSPGFDEEGRYIKNGSDTMVAMWELMLQGGYYTFNQVTNNTLFMVRYELDFITNGLSTQAKYSFDSFVFIKDKRSKTGFATYQPVEVDGEIYLKKSGEDGTLARMSPDRDKRRKEYFELALNYDRSFGRHTVTGLALYNVEKSRYYMSSYYDVPHAYLGFVGRATYNYDNRYFGEFNIGINGSENFPKGQRFGTFPAYSAGWAISEESFMEGARRVVNFLKIRGSYGEVGSDYASTRFLYINSVFSNYPGSYFQYYGEPSTGSDYRTPLQEGKTPNYNVTWETARKSNIGIDARFFSSRLSLTVDVFREIRGNILASMETYPSYLYMDMDSHGPMANLNYFTDTNYAKVKNQGIEVELGWDGSIGQEFRYFVKGTYAYSKNKALRLSETDQYYPYLYRTGRPLNEMRGLIAEGYWDSYEEIHNPNNPYNTFNPNPIPGDIKYRDVNGDMKIDEKDMVPLGKSNIPRTTFTASLGFDWKGLEVSALFQGASDVAYHPTYENQIMMMEGWGSFTWIADRWTPQQRNAKYPVLHYTNVESSSNYQRSTYWAYDATYVRLKNLEIAYNLPQRWFSRIRINGIRVFANGQNLWTWTKTPEMKRYDPEMVQTRTVYYPLMKIYNFGASVNF
ncbi:MAG: TonB-dependent receptor [Alistipes sp.]|nr:TonB-dependent receptor [Alistipes sp.]